MLNETKPTQNKKVVILGGGVAGMSAAHELIERGYDVEIYDRNPIYVGGKARSVEYHGRNIGEDYKDPLPGEHGFRFFPGFYKHITDTMQRIPFEKEGSQKTVYDNLVSVSREMLTRKDPYPPIITNASFPKTLNDYKVLYADIFKTDTLLAKEDELFFVERIWQIMTSCSLRRDNDYERISWWDFMQADDPKFSDTYRSLLVKGLLHTLVAAKAETASTKTAGNIFLQLVFCMTNPAINTDRILNGPTNDKWLNPWLDYLKSKNVKYFNGHEAVSIKLNANKEVSSATLSTLDGKEFEVIADYFIMAVPLERAALLISEELEKVDPTLAFIKPLAKNINWMNGIQFYLNLDVKINDGHIICSDTNWALTAFSQIQFWNGYDISTKGNGTVKGLLSIDISEWFQGGNFNNKFAANCTAEEIKTEVWEQMKMSLNIGDQVILKDEMLVDWYLDRDMTQKSEKDRYGIDNPNETHLVGIPNSNHDKKEKLFDVEPLLVNNANTWDLRPNANCAVNNLFFAADYVRTFTDLATMEGANEAARRAVNSLLNNDNNAAPIARVWNLEEPMLFKPLKWYDELRWKQGLQWTGKLPAWMDFIMLFWTIFCAIDVFLHTILTKIFPTHADLKAVSRRTWFILGSMAVAIGCLVLAAWKFHGWQSAALWGFGFSGLYLLYAVIFKDKLMFHFLVFTAVAGFTELLADNWLVVYTKTLHYPSEPTILSSPSYMPFSWVVVLMQVGYIGYLINKKHNLIVTSILVGLLGCCIIPFYEFLAIKAGWWSYSNTPMLGNVPIYIFVAEGLLMLSIPELFNRCESASTKAVVFLGFLQGLVMWLACIIAYHFFG